MGGPRKGLVAFPGEKKRGREDFYLDGCGSFMIKRTEMFQDRDIVPAMARELYMTSEIRQIVIAARYQARGKLPQESNLFKISLISTGVYPRESGGGNDKVGGVFFQGLGKRKLA